MADEDPGLQLNYLPYIFPVTKLLAILILLQTLIDSVIFFLPFLQILLLDDHRHFLLFKGPLVPIDLANNPSQKGDEKPIIKRRILAAPRPIGYDEYKTKNDIDQVTTEKRSLLNPRQTLENDGRTSLMPPIKRLQLPVTLMKTVHL